ncbi:MAG TPA: type II secretion system F family protein [Ornithinimicrobium sp.]|nr:type II secretion system F family protein [Ornithinimicrobium sp.]
MTALWAGVPAVLVTAAVLCWPTRQAWMPGAEGLRQPGGAGARGRPASPVTATRGPVLVAEALELIALALQGGGSVAIAVRTVGGVLPGPLGQDLQDVGLALQRGEDTERAWASVDDCWRPGVRSLRLAQVAGVAPGEALVQAARDLRREAVADVEVGAARLGVRLVLPLGLAYLPAFVLITVVPVVLALTRDLTW